MKITSAINVPNIDKAGEIAKKFIEAFRSYTARVAGWPAEFDHGKKESDSWRIAVEPLEKKYQTQISWRSPIVFFNIKGTGYARLDLENPGGIYPIETKNKFLGIQKQLVVGETPLMTL